MQKYRIMFSVLICVLLIPIKATARTENNQWLAVKLSPLDTALTENIFAHLGQLPDSAIQRRAYLFNLDKNINDALESMGYFSSKVNKHLIQHEKQAWELTLTVIPNEPTRITQLDVSVTGELKQDKRFREWRNQLNIKFDQILNQGHYEQAKAQLLTLALSLGYFDAKYSIARISVNRLTHSAKIVLHLNSGIRYKIGDIKFQGSDLEQAFLDKLIPFPAHSPYSTARISSLNQNLLAMGYFNNIKVLPQLEHLQAYQVPISVQLTPKPDNTIELGLGADIGNTANNNIEPRVRATWRTPQINRWGHSQETSIEWSRERPKFLSSYTIPLANPLRDKLQFKLGLLRDKYGVTQVYDAKHKEFTNTGQLKSTKLLFEILRQQQIQDNWLLSYSIQAMNEAYEQSGIEYDPDFLLLGLSLQKTVRGPNLLDPKSGYQTTYSIEYANPHLGSAIELTRLQARFLWIDTFYDKVRIVARLNLGINIASDNSLAELPPSLRYFAGGDNSIRGYSYQELGPYIETQMNNELIREVVGGRYLAVGSIEYQYYVTPSWRIAAFIDAGNAFDEGQFKPVVAVGPGLHWLSPIGPIKLDVGFGLDKTDTLNRSWRIHLTMGSVL